MSQLKSYTFNKGLLNASLRAIHTILNKLPHSEQISSIHDSLYYIEREVNLLLDQEKSSQSYLRKTGGG